MNQTAYIAGTQTQVTSDNWATLASQQIQFEKARDPDFSKANEIGIINALQQLGSDSPAIGSSRISQLTAAGIATPFDDWANSVASSIDVPSLAPVLSSVTETLYSAANAVTDTAKQVLPVLNTDAQLATILAIIVGGFVLYHLAKAN